MLMRQISVVSTLKHDPHATLSPLARHRSRRIGSKPSLHTNGRNKKHAEQIANLQQSLTNKQRKFKAIGDTDVRWS